MIKVIIYDDNNSLRESLALLLSNTEGFEVVGAFDNCETALYDVELLKPDIVLMDIDMPGMSGIEGVKSIRKRVQDVRIIMLTVFDDNKVIFEAIRMGANGYLLKKTDPNKLIEYIREAIEGGAPMSASIATQVLHMFAKLTPSTEDDFNLSDREKDVLRLLIEGKSYKNLGEELFISIDTVRAHIRKIYQKLHVNSKSEAVAKALRSRIV